MTEMTNSVPISLNGKDYNLRFEQDDVIACESELKMGYIFFFKVTDSLPITLSFLLCRTLLHHGLKIQNKKGELEYTFLQTPSGAIEAGDAVQEYMQGGGSLLEVWLKCRDAFELGWFAKPKPGDELRAEDPDPTKNSHGTG